MKLTIILLIILAVLVAAFVAIYFYGKKLEKRNEESQAQIAAAAQQATLLIIDKKRMPIKDSGLPDIVIEKTPKYLRRSKVGVVKAKVGPKIMTMIADDKIFDEIPVKKEVKATVSGIYITAVRGMRGPLEKPPVKKKGFRARMTALYESSKKKASEAEKNLKEEEKKSKKKK